MTSYLLTSTFLGLTTMLAFPVKEFPTRPLVGTFELYSSTPPLDDVDPRELRSALFQTGQRIRIEYVGEYGNDWPEREVYRIFMLPPFAKGFCLRPNWKHSCPPHDKKRLDYELRYPPTDPISHEAYLDTQIADTDKRVGFVAKFVPYGLKRGDLIYLLFYTDLRASYTFYFKDWDTIISQSAYNTQPDDHVVFVDQVLKRLITP